MHFKKPYFKYYTKYYLYDVIYSNTHIWAPQQLTKLSNLALCMASNTALSTFHSMNWSAENILASLSMHHRICSSIIWREYAEGQPATSGTYLHSYTAFLLTLYCIFNSIVYNLLLACSTRCDVVLWLSGRWPCIVFGAHHPRSMAAKSVCQLRSLSICERKLFECFVCTQSAVDEWHRGVQESSVNERVKVYSKRLCIPAKKVRSSIFCP